jgi:hypothetical protein
MEQQPDYWNKTHQFESQYTCKKCKQVKYYEEGEGSIEVQVINGANHIEIKIGWLFKYQFHRFGEMETIGDNDLWAIIFNRNHHRFRINQWIYLEVIYHNSQFQEAQHDLVLPGKYDIVRRSGQGKKDGKCPLSLERKRSGISCVHTVVHEAPEWRCVNHGRLSF